MTTETAKDLLAELDASFSELGPEFKHPLWSPKTAARALNRNERTLANERWSGRGLPYIRIGGKIFYRKMGVLQSLVENQVQVEA